jgi:ribosomal protein S27E
MDGVIAKVEVECPKCGQKQMESENFISTACRGCGCYIQATARTGVGRRKTKRLVVKKRELTCADCGEVQMVAEEAQSSNCLACGRHLELGHREILGEHLGNLSLEGQLTIGPKGNFGGAKARAAYIILKGRSSGALEAADWLRVEGQAKVRAGATGGRLEIKVGSSLECSGPVVFREGRIDGELRCGSARFVGLVEVGPKGKVVAEMMSFAELTAESGAQIRAQAETSAR